jgi:hypothetical protein
MAAPSPQTEVKTYRDIFDFKSYTGVVVGSAYDKNHGKDGWGFCPGEDNRYQREYSQCMLRFEGTDAVRVDTGYAVYWMLLVPPSQHQATQTDGVDDGGESGEAAEGAKPAQ